jgi:hypothetical protein
MAKKTKKATKKSKLWRPLVGFVIVGLFLAFGIYNGTRKDGGVFAADNTAKLQLLCKGKGTGWSFQSVYNADHARCDFCPRNADQGNCTRYFIDLKGVTTIVPTTNAQFEQLCDQAKGSGAAYIGRTTVQSPAPGAPKTAAVDGIKCRVCPRGNTADCSTDLLDLLGNPAVIPVAAPQDNNSFDTSGGGLLVKSNDEYKCDRSDDIKGCIQNSPIVNYINTALNILSAMVGVSVVIMIIVGGIQFAGSAGDANVANEAKKKIANALLALVVFIFAWAFLQWIVPGGVFS